MAGESTKDILETLLDKLSGIAATKTVVGDPVTVGDKIIVPVVKVTLGVGAGSGGANAKADNAGAAGGSGGGAGLAIAPVAFIVIDGHNIHLFGTKPSVLDNLTAKLPDMVNTVVNAIPKFKKATEGEPKEKKDEE